MARTKTATSQETARSGLDESTRLALYRSTLEMR